MSSWEVFTEQVADLARWGARVAADTKAFNEIRRIYGEMVEPNPEAEVDRLAYEAALAAASEEVRFVLDKKATQMRNEDLDAAEKARYIAIECTEDADVAQWAASLDAKEADQAKWVALDRSEQRVMAAEARAEEAEELVRQLKKEVEQVHLADMLAREATQRAETAERKLLRLSAVLNTFLQDRDPHLPAHVWAKFQKSMGE